MASSKVKVFSLSRYVENALQHAEYERDENGVIVAIVPEVSGFFTQGESYETARANLEDVIEGNVMLAVKIGWEIPAMPDLKS
jgi:predicted RNase H-like HicB family nuclease